MKKIYFLIIFTASGLFSFGQNSKPTFQSNYSFDFNTFLSGVKDAEIITNEQQEQMMLNNTGSAAVHFGVSKFLEEMGFETVGFSAKYRNIATLSFCNRTKVLINCNIDGDYINNFTITFYSCNGDSWTFKRDEAIIVKDWSRVTDKIYNAMGYLYGIKKPNYKESNRIKLKSESTDWTEEKLKTNFQINGAEGFEGIYENTNNSFSSAKYKVGVIKSKNGYDIVYLSGAINYIDWNEGDLKSKLTTTATMTMFKANWYLADKTINSDFYVSFETGLMNVFPPDKSKQLYLKLFPSSSDNIKISINLPSSGTGFAISNNGIIATNYHVTSGATKIKVRGVNGDFSKVYNAKVIIEDKNNDLAIIQIDDTSFISLGSIPYIISSKSSEVGTSIFVLGYPLRASMGDEIKLTNGIISSKSGFQGDVTTYQVTAPIQPGNSGGPMFDDKGNLIGIINAKHLGAENASYAIKSSYLLNLIELMSTIPALQTVSAVKTMTLSEQVKIVKRYTYIIEVNQ
jgi:S1-C subfamily serine protease